MKTIAGWFAQAGLLSAACAGVASSNAAEPATETLPSRTIVVTATRHDVPRLDYPGSISRIDGDSISAAGATHHGEIMNRAPGTLIQRGSGQESLTAIRSPVLTGPGSCGAFLFLEDGLPIRPTGFCNVNDLFEVNSEQAEAIEILRGPGSVLYGSNAVHGIVNVIMPEPSQLPPLGLALETGSDDYRRGRVAWSHVANGTDVGLLGHYTHDGGFREDSGFDEGKLNAALVRRAGDGVLRVRFSGTVLNQETAGFIQGFEAYRNADARRSNVNPEAFRDAHSLRASAHWQTPVAGDSEFNARLIARSSRMQFLQHFLLGKPLEENGQDSVAALLSWNVPWGEDTTLIAGIDAEYSLSSLFEFQSGPTTDGTPAANAIRPAGRHYDYEVDGASVAAYAQVEREFAKRWTLTAGLRGEAVEYRYDNLMIPGNTAEDGTPCPFAGCLYNRPADGTDRFENLAPKVALGYKLADTHRVYVSAGRGFRPPELTELYRLQRQQTVADLGSERIDAFELGVRGERDAFDYSLTAFHLEKRDVIFRDANGFNISDGETSHRGVEYEFGWQFAEPLRLSAAGTFARHRYEFDRAVEQGEVIESGNDVDTAPRQLHTARLDWSPSPQWDLQLEYLHVGEYFVDASNANRYDGHDLANLRARWRFAAGWHAAARVNNLLDTAYADRADFAFGNYRYFPGRDRSVFLEIGYSPGARQGSNQD